MQALESFRNGFWSAREWEFYQQPVVNNLLWLRIIPDGVFIVLGVVPLTAAIVWGAMHLRKGPVIAARRTTTREVEAELVLR
jgi:nitric oxide reductase subunit B